MNNDIDDKIKQDLRNQSQELDSLLDDGLGTYLKLGFSARFAWLTKVGYVLAIVLSVLMIYCGYRFFTALPDQQVFWGVCLIISFNAQVATKLWIFMQTNRNILSRELRLLELRSGANQQA